MISIWLKNICLLFKIHIITLIRTTSRGCGSFCLQSRVTTNWENPTREVLQLYILCSTYAAGWIWGVALYYSQVIKYCLRLTVDTPRTEACCRLTGSYDVNLINDVFTCTFKRLCPRCKCVKKEVSCFPFYICVCITTRETIVG